MRFLTCLISILALGACTAGSNYNNGGNQTLYSGYNNLNQTLDNLHNTAEQIKEAKSEYKAFDNNRDNYFENKIKNSWNDKTAEYRWKHQELKNKGERLKQDLQEIKNTWN